MQSSFNTGSYTFGNGSFTVEAWIYPQAAGAAAVRTIAAKYHTNPSGEIGGFHLYLNAAGQLEFKVGDAPVAPMTPPGRQGIIRTAAAITFNAWTHVAAVRAGNNPTGWTLYVNGIAVPTVIVNGAIMPTGIIEQGSPDQLYVGGGAAAGAPNS